MHIDTYMLIMTYFLKLLAEKQKMISFTKDNGETVAATVLCLYPHYFFNLSKENNQGHINLDLCSKSLLFNKFKLTKSISGLFEKRNLLPMQKVFRSKISTEILNQLVKNGLLHEKYNLLRYLYINKLECKFIDIVSKSKGLGFTGTIKRFNFKQGPKSHGSKSYNRPGSIGAGTTPGRVFRNKKMAGRHGNKKIILKNVEVLYKNNYTLIVKGPIPGALKKDLFVLVKFK